MDKFFLITMLYDFYAELLTDKQKNVIELYYFNDFSLHEIAQEYEITRQAVQDMIKRSEKLLMQYEQKLLLVDRYIKQKQKIEIIINDLNDIIDKNNLIDIKEFELIQNNIKNILD